MKGGETKIVNYQEKMYDILKHCIENINNNFNSKT